MANRIKDIENPLERFNASFERMMKIEAVREKNRLWQTVIKINVGITSILCAIYAALLQF